MRVFDIKIEMKSLLIGMTIIALTMQFSKQTGAQMASMTISGKLIEGGVECPAMMGDDGQLYSLIGNIEGFKSGQRVTVEGAKRSLSHCRRGTAIDVHSIRSADKRQEDEAPVSPKKDL